MATYTYNTAPPELRLHEVQALIADVIGGGAISHMNGDSAGAMELVTTSALSAADQTAAAKLAQGHAVLIDVDGAGVEGSFSATPDTTNITADGVDESVITLSPGGTYYFSVFTGGERVASGTVTDGTLEFSTTDAGAYTIRVIDSNATVKSVEITAS